MATNLMTSALRQPHCGEAIEMRVCPALFPLKFREVSWIFLSCRLGVDRPGPGGSWRWNTRREEEEGEGGRLAGGQKRGKKPKTPRTPIQKKWIPKSDPKKKRRPDIKRICPKHVPERKDRAIMQKHKQNTTKKTTSHNKTGKTNILSRKWIPKSDPKKKRRPDIKRTFPKHVLERRNKTIKQKHRQNTTKKQQQATTRQEKRKFAPDNGFQKTPTLRKREDLTSREFFQNISWSEKTKQ